MPTDLTLSDKAISNIIYFGGNGGDDCGCDERCTNVSVFPDVSYLGYLQPEELDIAFILNGQNGGIDVAIYFQGAWSIKPLKGEAGATGATGNTGAPGSNGTNGQNGQTGAPGAMGLPPEHSWSGTKLRFKNPDGSWATFVDLRGATGANGTNGFNGAKGDMPDHEWVNTAIKFQKPDNTWGTLVDLKGNTGATGLKGDKPNHEWNALNPTQIRFEKPDGTWGPYVDLKGAKGDTGATGADGVNGTNGTNGADGADGINGVDGEDGLDGADGADGVDATGNLQKVITGNYVVTEEDNNFVLMVDASGTVDIVLPAGLSRNFNVGFVLIGNADTTIIGDGTSSVVSYGNKFKIQDRFLGCFAEQIDTSNTFVLMGNLKV